MGKRLEEKVAVVTGEAVPVLGQHHVHVPGRHEITNPVHTRPLQARPTLSRIGDLLQDLVPFAGRVLS